ncbi:hypothetical protein [Mycolicibacterium celeriflavum]|uniref:hypothetical protein n=1 Tax=Mycolicibacterium celeriflavum TaxID=1249101 RepID=UPI003CE6A0CB
MVRHRLDAATTPDLPPEANALESAVVIVDADCVDSLFGGHPASRRRLRQCGDAICETASTAARELGARRVLVVCDLRGLSFGRGARAERWLRDLAHRIGYEGSINGLTGLLTLYAVVETDRQVHPIAEAVVDGSKGEMPGGTARLGAAAMR